MPHAFARLTEDARLLIAERVAAGHKPGEVAKQLEVSRAAVNKWLHRFAAEGPAGLAECSSRPRTSPARTPLQVELAVLSARIDQHAGARLLAAPLGLPVSTGHPGPLQTWQIGGTHAACVAVAKDRERLMRAHPPTHATRTQLSS